MTSRVERWRLRGLRIAARLRLTPLGGLVERGYTGFVAIEPFDRAMTLAAQAFVSIVPMMIVMAALRPNQDGFGSFMADTLGLTEETREALAGSVSTSASLGGSIGILGLLVALISATSYSRALERMYAKVWQVRRPGLRSAWRWLTTVLAVVLAIGLIEVTREATEGVPLPALWDFVVRVVVWAVVWTYVPWALLHAQVPVRVLAFTGGVTALLLGLLSLAGQLYLPIVLVSGTRQFGVLGLVFAYIGWLFVLSFALVLACVIGRACAQDEGVLGRVIRGHDDSVTWQTV